MEAIPSPAYLIVGADQAPHANRAGRRRMAADPDETRAAIPTAVDSPEGPTNLLRVTRFTSETFQPMGLVIADTSTESRTPDLGY